MDQSKSNKPEESGMLAVPKRSLSVEFWVGVFALAGVAAGGYLAVGLAGLELGTSSRYNIYADFDNVSGLKYGASVEIAGVPIGEVSEITLKDAKKALVTLHLDKDIKIKDDDTVMIRTKGIIGDRYVKISRGGSETYLPEGSIITDTESVVDLEDVIGKVMHSLTDGKDK